MIASAWQTPIYDSWRRACAYRGGARSDQAVIAGEPMGWRELGAQELGHDMTADWGPSGRTATGGHHPLPRCPCRLASDILCAEETHHG